VVQYQESGMCSNEHSLDEASQVGAATAVQMDSRQKGPQPASVLIVEDDRDLATVLADHLAETLRLEVTVATTCREAVDVELSRPHDVILADLLLPDGEATGLQRQLRGISSASFVLMSGVPTISRVVEAMRLGAMDFLVKPFDLGQMTAAVADALARHQELSRAQARYLRMRRLAKRILHDRRELRRRVDLVCRDLVQAYRRLAKRVVELYELYGYPQNN
jgi:DNA-binding NtrC family response regulator